MNIVFSVSCTAAFTIALPHLMPVLGLFTSIGMTTVMFLIPIIIESLTKWNDPRKAFILIKNVFITIIWILLMVIINVFNANEIFKF
jgi:hypothetical protein